METAPLQAALKPSFLQKIFASMAAWVIGFFVIAVGTALFIAIQAFPMQGAMFVLVITGAIVGLVVSVLFVKILRHVRVRINGGPFHKGDFVQVIAGPHAGRIATVYEEWPSRNQVRVDLGESECKEAKDVFSYVQLLKVKSASPPTESSQPTGA
jgi:urea transporter